MTKATILVIKEKKKITLQTSITTTLATKVIFIIVAKVIVLVAS